MMDALPKEIIIKLIDTINEEVEREYSEEFKKLENIVTFLEKSGCCFVKCCEKGCENSTVIEDNHDFLPQGGKYLHLCKECKIAYCSDHIKSFCCIFSDLDGFFYMCCNCSSRYDWKKYKNMKVDFLTKHCHHKNTIKKIPLFKSEKKELMEILFNKRDKVSKEWEDKIKNLIRAKDQLIKDMKELDWHLVNCSHDGCDSFGLENWRTDESYYVNCKNMIVCQCTITYCEKHVSNMIRVHQEKFCSDCARKYNLEDLSESSE